MSAASGPSPDRVLCALFWKLLFRGRNAPQLQNHRRRRQIGLGATILLYAALGTMPVFLLWGADVFIFASALHGLTLMFASLTLASSAGTMLFMKEEAEILLHRPVTPQQLLRSKCAVLVAFSLLLALSLNFAGLVAGPSHRGTGWLFIPVHLGSTALLMVFSASAIVLVYNACLKWFGRERFDNLLATLQSLLAILLMVSGQFMPRMMNFGPTAHSGFAGGWLLALPPVWFGALDALIAGDAHSIPSLWLPASLGLVATGLTTWLAVERLGSAYGQGLMRLNEAAGTARDDARPRGRWLSRLVGFPLLRVWLRDPVERYSFILTAAYLVRDREVKLRLYPGIAPMLIMPFFMLVSSGRRDAGDASMMLQGFASCFLAILPYQAMLFLRHSEHWRAAGFFHASPAPHWTPLFHGARKAVLGLIAFPALILQAGVMSAWNHSLVPLCLTLPAVLFLPAFSLVPALVSPWLPLSKPPEELKSGAGVLLVMGVMLASGAIGGIASWTWYLGWFWPFLGIEALVMGGAFALMTAAQRRTPWPPAND